MTPHEALIPLGFTDLEARLYCELLRSHPASGYRLAKLVGKAPANTYQALSSLLGKGAVMVDEGVSRAFRPTPVAELLSTLKKRFEMRATDAAAELANIEQPTPGDRIYQIKSVSALMERAVQMIRSADDIILFDAFPAPFENLRSELRTASNRGVQICGIVYTEVSGAGFTVVRAFAEAGLVEHWPGDQLTLVADAHEHLVALISNDASEVRNGIWSDSAYLSCLQHNALASEIRLLSAHPIDDDPLASIALLRAGPAGLRSLQSMIKVTVEERVVT